MASNHKAHNPLQVSGALYNYMLDHSLREDPVLNKLRLASEHHPYARMQSDPAQVQFMNLLLKLIGAKKGIELGVFLGYGTLAFAQTVPEDGKVIGCDISEEFVNFGRPFWQEANVSHKIDVKIGPAQQSLQTLIDTEGPNSFDFGFIDADKTGYSTYYELLLQLVRPGGIIFVDNVLWSGTVVDPNVTDADTEAIRAINTKIRSDDRVNVSLLTIGDGLTIAVKK
eukprot:CAMPEP_0184335192 /NCGR_PEP_ID=MMETSP1089-20130417/3807_1 /TAXON_ID=38269 ORGANISM="Gloeochaete wittrockiana, Strain SAG46.84" /NCGR_SAMPLE_ID=MMETSP1089 /ASSEMBLY_ACC=CAM_ASM_000445 /LENGTH=225 /DNA_ID=CAMNT_0026659741 /DNA_START=72 /DNA_END=749 /DNA_ORIENTATION=-